MRLEVFRYFVLLQLHNNVYRMEYKMHYALSCLSSHTNIFQHKSVVANWIQIYQIQTEWNLQIIKRGQPFDLHHSYHTFTHAHLKNDQFNKCFAKTNTYLENLNNNRERFSSLKSSMLYILLLCDDVQFKSIVVGFSSLSLYLSVSLHLQ